MKLFFLIQSTDGPSSRIRILENLDFLEKDGFSCDWQVIPSSFIQRWKLFKSLDKYDCVVLQKKTLSRLDLYQLRHHARLLCFDVDDAIYLKDSPSANYYCSRRLKRFANTVKKCDFVIAANKVLQKKVQEFNPKCNIIASPVETEGFSIKTDYRLQSPPRICWVGSSVTQKYLHYILPALQQITKEQPFKLVVISDKTPSLSEVDVEFIQWHKDKQYTDICQCDIGIMPLSLDPFSKGKASYKLLQYMACALPCVCSAHGMNREVSQQNTYCLEAATLQDFSEQVISLLENQKLREILGHKGRVLVESHYSRVVCSKRLSDLLKERLHANK